MMSPASQAATFRALSDARDVLIDWLDEPHNVDESRTLSRACEHIERAAVAIGAPFDDGLQTESPTSLTRFHMADALVDPQPHRMGGFVTALLDAYVKASPANREALALGFEWLPELHAAWLRR